MAGSGRIFCWAGTNGNSRSEPPVRTCCRHTRSRTHHFNPETRAVPAAVHAAAPRHARVPLR